MDLGIRGRSAIVMASSRGLGRACAESLAREGARVTINGRDALVLDATARDLRGHGVEVRAVVCDVREDATRAALLAACPAPDIVVTNNAGPAPASYRDWDREAWLGALEANLLAPALMVRDVLDGMVERRFGRIVNITSAMVKAPIGAMGLSSGARAGLTAAMKGASRDVARANVTINNLCPERFDTARQAQMADLAARVKGITVEEAYDEMRGTIAAGRLGDPAELGDTCAFLCSAQAGYLTGQSISLDGGTYPGLF
ncbi:MAG: SDR family oxidoreductase [Acidimicrobiales bacterium]